MDHFDKIIFLKKLSMSIKASDFTEKTFKITENVSFVILMAYFEGHPICQTKSLKLTYHGQLQEMKSGKRLYESLIHLGLQTIESVNLVNYLCRFIYGENLYEVYVNNSNQFDYASEMKEYILHNQSLSTQRLNNRFDLIEGLTNNANQIDQEELNKHRNNEDFPLVVHNFEEIENVPFFTYVQSYGGLLYASAMKALQPFINQRISNMSSFTKSKDNDDNDIWIV